MSVAIVMDVPRNKSYTPHTNPWRLLVCASGAESLSRHDTRAHTLTYTHTYAPHGLSCRRGVKHGHDQRTPSSQNHLVDTHTPHRLAPPRSPSPHTQASSLEDARNHTTASILQRSTSRARHTPAHVPRGGRGPQGQHALIGPMHRYNGAAQEYEARPR